MRTPPGVRISHPQGGIIVIALGSGRKRDQLKSSFSLIPTLSRPLAFFFISKLLRLLFSFSCLVFRVFLCISLSIRRGITAALSPRNSGCRIVGVSRQCLKMWAGNDVPAQTTFCWSGKRAENGKHTNQLQITGVGASWQAVVYRSENQVSTFFPWACMLLAMQGLP